MTEKLTDKINSVLLLIETLSNSFTWVKGKTFGKAMLYSVKQPLTHDLPILE
jgi:hypothetical protein